MKTDYILYFFTLFLFFCIETSAIEGDADATVTNASDTEGGEAAIAAGLVFFPAIFILLDVDNGSDYHNIRSRNSNLDSDAY